MLSRTSSSSRVAVARAGAAAAGASAGAMILAAWTWTATGGLAGLGLVPGIVVVPHAERVAEHGWTGTFARRVPPGLRPLGALGLAHAGADRIEDVVTCPGAYTCNLGITKTMNLGAALQEAVRHYDDPQVRRLTIKASGCPNACGHHWIGDFGFYGNARKIDGREVPYYLMLLGGGTDADGILRFGLAVQSLPARLGPVAVRRVLDHFLAHRLPGERFRDYVLRFKLETFREMVADLAKPAELFPELYQDWGDSDAYSLKLGRGECAV